MKKINFAILLLMLFSCKEQKDLIKSNKSTDAPNIILIIGDGTGLSQLSSLWYYGDEKPNYQRFQYVGLSKTNSSSHKITDSGAGATAFSIGEKSYNGSIGVAPDSLARPNLIEILSKKSYVTGLISTSSITHATPASFYAHVKSRQMHEEIAEALWLSEVDFFAGGGLRFFQNRKDKANGISMLEENGFTMNTNSIDQKLEGAKIGFLLANDGLPKVSERKDDYLVKSSKVALEFLDKKESPFFLMIEGSQVDWGGHNNDADYVISELKELDKAVGIALDFAEKDGNTLVIALADHETGGFALSPTTVKSFGGKDKDDYNIIDVRFTTGGHTASHIPVFAYGPGAEKYTGIYENSTIFNKILKSVSEQ